VLCALSLYFVYFSAYGGFQGTSKKNKKKQALKKKIWRKATDRLPLPFFFFFLGAPFKRYARRLHGHATADGHPQRAAGSSFAS
jgi:hypothetical protein